jgi:hypothetical protein
MSGDYAVPLMNNRDTVIALGLVVVLLCALYLDIIPVRVVLVLPLLFFMTGHLALRVIRTVLLPPVEHILAAVGMSIAICLLGCFVLYGFSALTPLGWTVWLATVIIGLSAWIIRSDLAGGLAIQLPNLQKKHAMTLLLAGAIASGAYLFAIHAEDSTREFSYTEFWLVPTKANQFVVGFRNEEFQPETYDLLISSHDSVVSDLHSIHLNPGEKWTRVINSQYRTLAILYLRRGADRIVYRRVSALASKDDKESAAK